MKNSITLLLILFSTFCIATAQEIKIHSVTTDRQASGDRGYTLDGLRMVNHATPKIINPDNFGDMIYPKYTNLTHSYGVVGSLEEITSIGDIDIFFFGMFNKLEPTLNQFTQGEIDSLHAWSKRGGKLIIGASGGAVSVNFDPSVLNNRWGFNIETILFPTATLQLLPTDAGLESLLFDGPFGTVPFANQGGAAQGYFVNMPADAVILAVDSAGNPNLILDCNTLDLIIADIDAWTDLGGVSYGDEIQNNNDIFLLNTIAYMDQLQGPPAISQAGSTLSAGGSYLSYQWLLDGQPISGANDSTYIITSPGNYSVQVNMSCGCTTSSEPYFAALTGLDDASFESYDIEVSPNPVKDKLTFKFNIPGSTSVRLNVYNSSGQEVTYLHRSFLLPNGKQSNDLDVSSLPSGVYEVVLSNGGHLKTVRFIR